jgi:tellurite methyltransferase
MASWDERYQRGEHGNAAPLSIIERAARCLPPGRALDVACGTGRHALLLAELGWHVTAVDSSRVALEQLQTAATERGLCVEARLADLERGEFVIAPGQYDLIVVTCYLQRDQFPALRAGVRVGGLFAGVIAVVDDDPLIMPMNPAFLLAPGELRATFADWELLHCAEVKEAGRRTLAELIARRPSLAINSDRKSWMQD